MEDNLMCTGFSPANDRNIYLYDKILCSPGCQEYQNQRAKCLCHRKKSYALRDLRPVETPVAQSRSEQAMGMKFDRWQGTRMWSPPHSPEDESLHMMPNNEMTGYPMEANSQNRQRIYVGKRM